MDVVNVSRSRRFLRERPMHVNLFDRPRMVVDIICLEAGQQETRSGFDRSDSMLLLVEGEARLRAGPQIESLQEMDAVLIPPGQEYEIGNTGAGRLTAISVLTPKPSRADEVQSPSTLRPLSRPGPTGEGRAQGDRFPRDPGSPAHPRRSDDRAPASRSASSPPRPPGGPRRYEGSRPPAGGRGRGGKPGGNDSRRSDQGEGPVWYPKPKPTWRPRGAPPAAGGGRPAGTRASGSSRPPGGSQGAPSGPPRRGAPPAAGGGRPAGTRASGSSRSPGGSQGAPSGPPRRRSGPPNTTGGKGTGGDSRGRPPSGGPRRKDNRKTGDARKASRGQGPQSGRRGQGHSGPRT